jgi:glycosyltransferase involved in cell wall biosynthesis
MRIAFVSDAAFPWHMGGIEAVERAEAEELAKIHEVHFFSMQWPGMEHEFTDKRIQYHTLGKTSSERFYRHGRRSIRAALKFAASTINIFRFRFSVIECNMFPILHIPVLRLYCKLFGCKLVLDVVEVWDRNYWKEYLKNPLFAWLGGAAASLFVKMADAYIANSSVTAQKLEKIGILRSKISVFAPILNDNELKPFISKEGKRNTIVYWGRLIKEKRLDKWILAVKEAQRKVKGARGLIIGDGPEEKEIRGIIKKERLQNIIKIRRPIVKREELWEQIGSCAVLLHMSEREGLGLVVLESIALGIPVVLPSYTPIPKEVRDMCLVESEESIPEKLAEILRSQRHSKYIKNRENLSEFEISGINRFYERLFSRLRPNGR